MYLIFNPANGFIYYPSNFPDVVIGVYFTSLMVFFSNLLWEASFILRSKYKKIRLHIYCLG